MLTEVREENGIQARLIVGVSARFHIQLGGHPERGPLSEPDTGGNRVDEVTALDVGA